jgi:hypothetical protein
MAFDSIGCMGYTPAKRDWIAENENIFIATDRNNLGTLRLILNPLVIATHQAP